MILVLQILPLAWASEHLEPGQALLLINCVILGGWGQSRAFNLTELEFLDPSNENDI